MQRRLLTLLACTAALTAGIAPAVLFAPPAAAAPQYLPGDFDGDGHRDLAAGAPGHDRVRVSLTRSGHVVYLHANAASTIPTAFGSALAVGDFNGDGYSDLAVGAPDFLPPGQTGGFGNPETEGAVFEFYGSSTGLHARPLRLTGPYDGDEPFNLGSVLATADVNRDGRTDLAATLYGADIEVEFFRGSATGLTTSHMQDLDGGFDPSALAFGDVNGDHRPDLIVGADNDFNDDGSLRVFRGASTGALSATASRIHGSQVGVHEGLGSAVAVGDVNGDGRTDVVVGAATDRDSTGKHVGSVVLLTGGSSGLSATRHQRITETRINPAARNLDGFGASVAIGKVTSDGYADVAVGTPGASVSGHAEAGAVYLLRGSHSGLALTPVQRLTQSTAGVPGLAQTRAHFGATLFAAQLVGAANVDLAIGAPDGSYGAAHGGLVVRLRGAASGLTTAHAAVIGDATAGDHLGFAIR